jgi:hypothetical protein
VTVYVITNHEFRVKVAEGRFEWYNVTERLGVSYITPDQGVRLSGNKEFIDMQSMPIVMKIEVEAHFRTNQAVP